MSENPAGAEADRALSTPVQESPTRTTPLYDLIALTLIVLGTAGITVTVGIAVGWAWGFLVLSAIVLGIGVLLGLNDNTGTEGGVR